MCVQIIDVRVFLSYPGGHRKSRVAPACCSTWPRTHRSWWEWRRPSPRPASPRRRPACASCSVCRRRNETKRRFGKFITLKTNDPTVWLKIGVHTRPSASASLLSKIVSSQAASRGFNLSLVLLNSIHWWLVTCQSRQEDHPTIHSQYLPSFSWLAGAHFLPEFKTHNSKMFSACGPVRQRPHLTVPSVTLATPSGRTDSDWLKLVSHSYGLK